VEFSSNSGEVRRSMMSPSPERKTFIPNKFVFQNLRHFQINKNREFIAERPSLQEILKGFFRMT
jgi:hypothetical protein